jgi:hypothetical protein
MAINTYVELDRATLTSNSGPVTFTNIPQTYTDLRIVFKGGFVDSGFMIGARVGNGSVDTGANYSYQLFRASSSGVENSYRKSGMVFGAFCQQGGNNLHNVMTVDFFNYSNTTTFKTWSSRYSNPTEGIDAAVSLWRSTAAINTISIAECGDGGSGSFNYGNMLSGTTISLYGIKAWANTEASTFATGGYVYQDSSYWYHAFPFSGTFTPSQTLTCDILQIAGGGGGGQDSGGGGGAGGLLYFSSQSITAGAKTVTVGAGGKGSVSYAGKTSGSNSQFASLTASVGGGVGAGFGGYTASVGGSGGGASGGGGPQTGAAGTAGQGNSGGGSINTAVNYPGGGGGGAGGAGGTPSTGTAPAGAGGVGVSTYSSWGIATQTGHNVNGTIWYAGGGGGSTTIPGAGGLGGGGNGTGDGSGTYFPAFSQHGLVSTGGGGGGGASQTGATAGGNGGSGLVIVRYAK